MPSLIEKYASKDIILLQYPTVNDGKTTFLQRIQAKAIVSDFAQADFDYFGNITNGKIFYVSPLDDPPVLPGKIIYQNHTFDIQGVRIYENLSGKLYGYKIAAVGKN